MCDLYIQRIVELSERKKAIGHAQEALLPVFCYYFAMTPLDIIDQLLQTKTFLSEHQTKTIFLSALHTYFSTDKNPSIIQGVAIQLYYEWNKPFIIETQFEHDLAHALLAATEFYYEYTRLQEEKRNVFLDIESELRKYVELKKN